jgi:hypothetical protein
MQDFKSPGCFNKSNGFSCSFLEGCSASEQTQIQKIFAFLRAGINQDNHGSAVVHYKWSAVQQM